jgi:hypothetical protein
LPANYYAPNISGPRQSLGPRPRAQDPAISPSANATSPLWPSRHLSVSFLMRGWRSPRQGVSPPNKSRLVLARAARVMSCAARLRKVGCGRMCELDRCLLCVTSCSICGSFTLCKGRAIVDVQFRMRARLSGPVFRRRHASRYRDSHDDNASCSCPLTSSWTPWSAVSRTR